MEDVGGHRKLYNAAGLQGVDHRGTFCYTYCGRGRRLEEITDTLDLQRLLEDSVAIFRGASTSGYGGNTGHKVP
jgi:hypothetical protein